MQPPTSEAPIAVDRHMEHTGVSTTDECATLVGIEPESAAPGHDTEEEYGDRRAREIRYSEHHDKGTLCASRERGGSDVSALHLEAGKKFASELDR